MKIIKVKNGKELTNNEKLMNEALKKKDYKKASFYAALIKWSKYMNQGE